MPEALTKKMFGLPRWAWLTILAVAIGIGLYLRYRQKKEDEESTPTDEESTAGLVGSEPVPVGGYDQMGEGGGYYYGYSPGGGYGGFEGFNESAPAPPEININVGESTLPSATDGEAHTVQTGQTPCNQRPQVPQGFHAECVSGRWKIVANQRHRGAHPAGAKTTTGGGPPNRHDDKGPKHKPSGGGGGGGTPSGGGGQGPGSEGHPRAVDTGNNCVRGGVGGHTAPPGYHLYCGGNGHIWRAPNA